MSFSANEARTPWVAVAAASGTGAFALPMVVPWHLLCLLVAAGAGAGAAAAVLSPVGVETFDEIFTSQLLLLLFSSEREAGSMINVFGQKSPAEGKS